MTRGEFVRIFPATATAHMAQAKVILVSQNYNSLPDSQLEVVL